MKRYILFFLLQLNIFLVRAQSPITSPITAVGVSNTALLAVADNKVYKSTDGSTSYVVDLTMSTGAQVNAMALDADGYGFIVGNNGLAYRITPTSYTQITPDSNPNDDKGSGLGSTVNLQSVTFSSRDTGYVTEANGIVLKTTDGGFHWKQAQSGGLASPLIAMGTTQKGTLVDGNGTVNKLRDITYNYSTRNWYDELGRLVLSQNAKQFYMENYLTSPPALAGTGTIRAYSYTLYDDIGRIIEVGELLTRAAVPMFKHESQVQYSVFTGSFILAGVQREITKTYYDRVRFTSIYAGFTQENLRPRVASVTYQDVASSSAYDRATHYSYDIHGNVKSLIQEINANSTTLKKRLDYDYDLVSGKVNFFYYQKDQPDQLIHKYLYDGDNRIVQVLTLRDGIIWDRDAKYDYMAHGPLGRTAIGEKEIEQNNYAYTVQGWIKGVNGNNFSYALGYFDDGTHKDYESITNANTNLPTPINGTRSLYNGNIATMASNTPQFATEGGANWTQQFEYDQLNRIMQSTTVGGANPNSFKTSYTYDAGGNITNLKRFDIAGVQYDNMQYIYQNVQNDYNKNTNKLRSVDDDGAFKDVSTTDINDQDVDNYQYDDIGNLIQDTQEGIANIEWTVYGKIRKVTRTAGSTKPDLEFAYDASGNRVSKTVIDKSGSVKTTYYVKDASGNVLSIYEKDNTTPLTLAEQYVFGSSRLATMKPTYSSDKEIHITGQKEYEFSDHLGDVRVTLNDKGIVTSAFDPLPFGMVARNYNPTDYRYGFNGKESDFEIHNSGGTSYDFTNRIYDPRLCRFLSVDPLTKQYPELTPYQFASNRPIDGIDLDGLEHVRYYYKQNQDGSYTQLGVPKALDVYAKGSKGFGIQVRLIGADGKVKDVFVRTNAPPPAPKTTKEKAVEAIDAVTPAMDKTAEGFSTGGLVVAEVSALALQPEGVAAGGAAIETGAVIEGVSTGLKVTKAVIEKDYKKAFALAALAYLKSQFGKKVEEVTNSESERRVIDAGADAVAGKVEEKIEKPKEGE